MFIASVWMHLQGGGKEGGDHLNNDYLLSRMSQKTARQRSNIAQKAN